MNEGNFKNQYNLLFEQRKKLVYLVISQSIVLIILAVSIAYLVLNPTVVVVPTAMDSMFKVQGNKLSENGLVQHANYFIHLYLDLTPETIDAQYAQLLQNIYDGAQIEFKRQLSEHEGIVKRLHLSSRFDIKKIATNVKTQTVIISGTLVLYQGPSLQSVKDKNFIMQFENKLGRPFISRISELKNEN
jgi:type IV conjugative transfer system protein TraE